MTSRQKNTTISPVSLISMNIDINNNKKKTLIQLSAHLINSKLLLNEIKYIFPILNNKSNNNNDEIIIIPTMQQSQYDLVNVNSDVDTEKDLLLLTVRLL